MYIVLVWFCWWHRCGEQMSLFESCACILLFGIRAAAGCARKLCIMSFIDTIGL